MEWEQKYRTAREKLRGDPSICSENRELFERFFEFLEYKLKRRNGLSRLDRGCCRTLLAYVTRLRTANRWFRNKPWIHLTKADIRRIYDDLEEGRITTLQGASIRDRSSFYNKIFRGKPFQLAGKAEIAREVLAYSTTKQALEVRFIQEETFRTLVDSSPNPEHRLLLWLCFDVGENASAILSLRKSDCTRHVNRETGEPEYRVNLRRETLKRSRRARSEITNYRETAQYMDLILASKVDDDLLFEFGAAQAAKILRRAVGITGARCLPAGQPVTLKDLRSSMACDLLGKGWSTDEVNARLGHKPSSRELDKYVNFLALNCDRPKRKFQETQITALIEKLEAFQHREKLHVQRQERLRAELDELKKQRVEDNRLLFLEVRRLAERLPLELRDAG